MKLLHIDASIQGDKSVSRDLSELIVKRLTESDPGAEVIYRDLTHANLPHLTIASLPNAHPIAAAAGPLDATEQAVRATSDLILSEFLAADTIVIGAPMYNFTIPSQLKAWIDRIIVPGTTFQYGANGQEGLAGHKRVIVALARGGLYGPGSAHVSAEHAESYLRAILGYIGITRLKFVVAEGLLLGEELKTKSVTDANDSVRRLAA